MRTLSLLILSLIIVAGCGKHQHDEHGDHGDSLASQGNQALYDEVMKVHDEAMGRMGEIHSLKRALRQKMDSVTAEKKIELEAVISRLDSADQGMMDWMHEFKPIGDSEGEEKAREYLENEMEKVKTVRSNIQEAIKEGKSRKENK